MPSPVSLAQILGAHGDALKNEIRKVLPATVTNVSADRQTVDVQIAINNPIFDEVGNVYSEPAPSLSDVPCGVLRGGGMLIWMPLEVGDSVLLVFSDLSCDTWREGDGTPRDPGFVGKHTHDSAFAIPMIDRDAKFFVDPADSSAAGKLLIGKDGGAAQIRISPTDIELGNNATKAIALAEKIDLFIQTVMSWTPVPNDGGAALLAALVTAGFTTRTTTASGVAKSQP